MAGQRAAKRYAKALFDLAVERGAVEAVRADLQALAGLLRDAPDFAAFAGNYLLPSARRVEALRALLESRAHELVTKFVLLLETKKRLAELGAAIEAFEARYDEHRGLAHATVTSAHGLSDAQRDALTGRLKQRLGKEIRLHEAVNPALIGGFQVQVGDLVHDYSVETQLQRLRARFLTA
jgi:F-type H+-transporting ATPase subunit delta